MKEKWFHFRTPPDLWSNKNFSPKTLCFLKLRFVQQPNFLSNDFYVLLFSMLILSVFFKDSVHIKTKLGILLIV